MKERKINSRLTLFAHWLHCSRLYTDHHLDCKYLLQKKKKENISVIGKEIRIHFLLKLKCTFISVAYIKYKAVLIFWLLTTEFRIKHVEILQFICRQGLLHEFRVDDIEF